MKFPSQGCLAALTGHMPQVIAAAAERKPALAIARGQTEVIVTD
jgi:hypothetical protein